MTIDLRSDTTTRPTPAMREAIASAVVGDDVFGADPTVNELQDRVAELLGHEAGLFVPSGTMSNQIALAVHARPGDEVLAPHDAHVLHWEAGGLAAHVGAMVRPIHVDRGHLDAATVTAMLRPGDVHQPRSALIWAENTHVMSGGSVLDVDAFAATCHQVNDAGVAVHLDGARLFNAQVAAGVPARAWAAHADTVSVCLSKGMGAPVGSVLCGRRDLVELARTWRKRFGGAMRQAGVLAAAGLVALEEGPAGMAQDHANARWFADQLREHVPELLALPDVPSNMVWLDLASTSITADDAIVFARERGVLLGGREDWLRLVWHRDVSREGTEQALAVFLELLATADRAS